MCSLFGAEMEDYQGDLTDILRASSSSNNNSASASASDHINPLLLPTWQFPSSDPLSFCSSFDDHLLRESYDNLFGDPFSSIQDPLLHDLNLPNTSAAVGFYNPAAAPPAAAAAVGVYGRRHHDELKSPRNIISRIQISSSSSPSPASSSLQKPAVSACDSRSAAAVNMVASPRGIKAPVMVGSDMIINANNNTSPPNCLVDTTTGPGGQIPSPRNLGIKRRKSQAKKVVCIPAPAAANSRSSGEVVPSDLWAWRKYGQKPIKGSPYPRGYYRCSSSKGCSARKQVERSRTDPNMLVITYTSEHNHPWPTQRNALAGSTRSQPSSKSNINASSSSSVSSPLCSQQPRNQNTTNKNNRSSSMTKEEEEVVVLKESSNGIDAAAPNPLGSVKEETHDQETEDQKPIDDYDDSLMDHQGGDCDDEFNNEIYKPELPDHHHHEDFFADLGEVEADPLHDLLFSHQGFNGNTHKQEASSKGLDPFNIFDWSSGENNNNNSSSTSSPTFGETKRGFMTRP